jgi:hypothetical protein
MGKVFRTNRGNKEAVQNFGRRNHRGSDSLGNLGLGGKLILKWIVQKCVVKVWTG